MVDGGTGEGKNKNQKLPEKYKEPNTMDFFFLNNVNTLQNNIKIKQKGEVASVRKQS